MWAFWVCAALAGDYDALVSEDGWTHLELVHAGAAGDVQLDVKQLDTPCLRATATVDLPADVLLDVVTDVPGAGAITRETLLASEVLGEHDGAIDYYQHLDVPGWTLSADRYWVVRGQRSLGPNGPQYRWSR
jgi:hypothetical protein